MRAKRWIRALHVYGSLQAGLALSIFAISALVASVETDPERDVTRVAYDGPLLEDDLEQARAVHAVLGGRFEREPAPWMVAMEGDGRLLIRQKAPTGARQLRLDRSRREVEISAERNSFAEFLNQMHQESFVRRKPSDSAWLWAWSAYLEISILALFALPLSGLYLWWTTPMPRRWVSPVLGAAGMLLVVVVGLFWS